MSETLLDTKPLAWQPALETIATSEAALRVSSLDTRASALERYRITTANRERPGRYWKIDLDQIESQAAERAVDVAHAEFSGGNARGLILRDLESATRDNAAGFQSAFGRAIAHAPGKYAALTQALQRGGAFVHVPADVCVDEPIVITYRASRDTAIFPYTLIVADQGCSATIIERYESDANVFIAGITEVVARDSSSITHTAVQRLPEDSTVFSTRAALLERSARLSWAVADLGAHVSSTTVFSAIEGTGADSHIAALFFPHADQHVDFITTTDHLAGESVSRTLIKSAASGDGQARYLGNIRIAATMHGCDASLKDDALLLSPRAHIDSVPALEIAANDVKAFHGATVGALDDETIFYMTTRGLERQEAERMITLGFFEPVLEYFPTNALREELRQELARKIASA
ncbi:MAG: Fe-S cluster assembly protein SufD [Candidatus Eremiobacteraeota bacterium]|nr:Fe-S cluster assembly protein SufD [Candidatus Eremiobacteraeota bacterium]